MVKTLMYISIAIIISAILYFAGLSLSSRKQPVTGLFNAQLRPCPDSPNCVCSEQADRPSYIEAFSYQGSDETAWQSARQAIINTGGELFAEQADYLHAIYITPLMRYRDDLELRLDRQHRLIHIRSASRVGHSDLGANRKRGEQIRSEFTRALGANLQTR